MLKKQHLNRTQKKILSDQGKYLGLYIFIFSTGSK